MARRRRRRSPGEGAVYERPDRGTWVAALIVGYHPNGNFKRRTKTFTNKGDAEKWLHAQQAALTGGARLSDDSTLRDVYNDWLENGETLLGWSTATTASYKRVLKGILVTLGGTRVRELDSDVIEKALRGLARGGASPAFLRRVRSHVGMVLRRAERRRLILRNPIVDVDVPVAPEPRAERWTEAEVGKVIRAALEVDDQVARYAIVALGTGLRTEELLGLATGSVSLEERTITVERVAVEVEGRAELRAGGKTAAATRVLPVDDLTLGALARQLEHVDTLRGARAALDAKRERSGKRPLGWAGLDLLFPSSVGTVWSRTVLRRAFDALQAKAGVTRIRLYATRHTHGSLLADAGVNLHALAERLGHTDPRFTARVYLRGSEVAHRAVAERVGSVLGSSLVAAQREYSDPPVHEEQPERGVESEKARLGATN